LFQVLAALLVLIAVPGRSAFSAASIDWVDPSPPSPEATAPPPPRQSPSQPLAPAPEASAPLPPRQPPMRSAVQRQQSALPPAPHSYTPPPRLHRALPRSTLEDSVIAAQAREFIKSYWEQSSASGEDALNYLRSIYAPVVDYYGQRKTRDGVLQDKRAFVRRWPIRQTWPAPEAEGPSITCDNAAAECEITGVRDFAAESPERNARSAGLVRYSYRVSFLGGSAQIVEENSKVVAAGPSAVSSPAALPPAR
jgi:hypothetical protein